MTSIIFELSSSSSLCPRVTCALSPWSWWSFCMYLIYMVLEQWVGTDPFLGHLMPIENWWHHCHDLNWPSGSRKPLHMLLSYFLHSNRVFEVILGMIGLLFSVWQKWKGRCFTSYKQGLGMEFGTESQRWIAGALLGMRHHSLNCGVRSISNTEGKSSVLLMDFKIFFSPNLETFLEND